MCTRYPSLDTAGEEFLRGKPSGRVGQGTSDRNRVERTTSDEADPLAVKSLDYLWREAIVLQIVGLQQRARCQAMRSDEQKESKESRKGGREEGREGGREEEEEKEDLRHGHGQAVRTWHYHRCKPRPSQSRAPCDNSRMPPAQFCFVGSGVGNQPVWCREDRQ